MGHVTFQTEAKAFQNAALFGGGNIHAHERLNTICIQTIGSVHIRHFAGNHNVRRLAAT